VYQSALQDGPEFFEIELDSTAEDLLDLANVEEDVVSLTVNKLVVELRRRENFELSILSLFFMLIRMATWSSRTKEMKKARLWRLR